MLLNEIITIEQEILGSFIKSEKVYNTYCNAVKEKYFSNTVHKNIFRYLKEMNEDGISIDLVNFLTYNQKRIKEINSVSYISEISECNPSISNLESKIELLINNFKLRVAKEIIPGIAEASKNEEVTKIMEEALKTMYAEGVSKDDDGINDFEDYINWLYEENADNGFKSGLYKLDEILGNFKRGRMITIFARSGVGKSTVAIQIALNMALQKVKVIYGSGEMSKNEVFSKMAASKLDLDYKAIINRALPMEQKERVSNFIASLTTTRLLVCNETDIDKFINKVKLEKIKNGVDIIFVDYVNKYIGGVTANSLTEKIGIVTSKLKDLALTENICVVLLAQANRKADEKIGEVNEKVTENDIQDSARIEQDSDQIIALYRNKKFDNREYREGCNDIDYSSKNADKNPEAINMIIQKNRHGEKGTKAFKWNGAFSKITNFMQ